MSLMISSSLSLSCSSSSLTVYSWFLYCRADLYFSTYSSAFLVWKSSLALALMTGWIPKAKPSYFRVPWPTSPPPNVLALSWGGEFLIWVAESKENYFFVWHNYYRINFRIIQINIKEQSEKSKKVSRLSLTPSLVLLLAKYVDELENHGIGLLLKEVVVCVWGRCLIVIIIMFEAFPSMKTQFAEM